MCIGVNLVFYDVDIYSFEGHLQGTSVLKLLGKIRESSSTFHFDDSFIIKNTDANIVVFLSNRDVFKVVIV